MMCVAHNKVNINIIIIINVNKLAVNAEQSELGIGE